LKYRLIWKKADLVEPMTLSVRTVRNRKLAVAALALIALSSSCAPAVSEESSWREANSLPEAWDGGFLSQKPCGPPCFAGIVPGQTSEAEAIRISELIDHLRECHLEDRPNQGRWIECQGAIVNIDKSTSIVDSLGFRTLEVLTLGDAIAQYGKPDYLYFVPDGTPEHPYIRGLVCFDMISARVDLERQQWPTYEITSALEITNISYGQSCFAGLDHWKEEWRGYGDY
jgi:hypothetical protein